MANKPKRERPTDETVRTAENLINAGRAQLEPVVKELQERIPQLEKLHLDTGAHRAFRAIALMTEYLAMKSIADIITNKSYRLIPGVKTVHEFCKSYGIPYNTAYENARITRALTEEEYTLFSKIGLTRQDFLGYAALPEDQRLQVKEGVLINVEKADKTQFRALLEELLAENKREREERAAEERKLKRKAADKERENDNLRREAGDLEAKLAARAKQREMTPEEDQFLALMDELKTGFYGYMLKVEPQFMKQLTPDCSPVMRAAYIELIGNMLRQLTAAHDTAVEMFGADMALEGERWSPPTDR